MLQNLSSAAVVIEALRVNTDSINKAPANMNLKMLSAYFLCCIYLITLLTLIWKSRGEQCGSRSDCSL